MPPVPVPFMPPVPVPFMPPVPVPVPLPVPVPFMPLPASPGTPTMRTGSAESAGIAYTVAAA